MTTRSAQLLQDTQKPRIGLLPANFPRRTVLALTSFLALSCVSGGLELMMWRTGNRYLPPIDVLQHTPFTSYFVPGLVLALVVGGAQIVCATLTWHRSALASLGCAFAGGSLCGWIAAEAAMLRSVHPIHALYVAAGAVQLALGVHAALRSGAARDRWIVLVTGGELLGFAFPAATGILLSKVGVDGPLEVAALAAAGACEGLLLGAAQAFALPVHVRRLRYAGLTALAAAAVWTCAMTLVHMMSAEHTPRWVIVTFGVATGVFGLVAIGGAQWLELRHQARRAWRFIAWTALAWLLALPFSFSPGPFVDETTPFGPQLALWTLGGVMMALVMALITWLGVRQIAFDRAAQRA